MFPLAQIPSVPSLCLHPRAVVCKTESSSCICYIAVPKKDEGEENAAPLGGDRAVPPGLSMAGVGSTPVGRMPEGSCTHLLVSSQTQNHPFASFGSLCRPLVFLGCPCTTECLECFKICSFPQAHINTVRFH